MADHEHDPKLGTIIAERYRLLERLGAGGMGVVYRAERVGIDKVVALKLLHDDVAEQHDFVRRFEREVSAANRLAHPHLVGVIDSGKTGGSRFLVMDFFRGRPLGSLLASGALDPVRAVGIVRQMLAGLSYAHAGGVVHRDLKPDNVMLLDGEDDFVKILDFGLAKIVRGQGEDASQLTKSGTVMGTPSYMSPEQASGRRADRRSDVYSTGVILYHMVTGRKPFEAETPIAILQMQIDVEPERPRSALGAVVSDELEQVILRALEKSASRRWQTADEFRRALEATPEGRRSRVPLVDLHGTPAQGTPARVAAVMREAQERALTPAAVPAIAGGTGKLSVSRAPRRGARVRGMGRTWWISFAVAGGLALVAAVLAIVHRCTIASP